MSFPLHVRFFRYQKPEPFGPRRSGNEAGGAGGQLRRTAGPHGGAGRALTVPRPLSWLKSDRK